jgi:hypothetical protein
VKIKNFSSFLKSRVNENSDMDFSMQTWGEVGQDSHPPNSGFEGTSGEPMDYTAGYTGEEEEEDPIIIDDERVKERTKEKRKREIEELKAKIEDLTERIKSLEPEKEESTSEEQPAAVAPEVPPVV